MPKVERFGVNWQPPNTIPESKVSEGKREAWLNPIAMRTLQIAVEAKKKQVVLNEITYNITYGVTWESSYDGKHEGIKLKRADGVLTPFGYVRLRTIQRFQFEEAE
jgi:hypothetical protein